MRKKKGDNVRVVCNKCNWPWAAIRDKYIGQTGTIEWMPEKGENIAIVKLDATKVNTGFLLKELEGMIRLRQ